MALNTAACGNLFLFWSGVVWLSGCLVGCKQFCIDDNGLKKEVKKGSV